MSAPRNYSHLTPNDISQGRKYHITIDEQLLLGQVNNIIETSTLIWNNTYSTVLANSAQWINNSNGSSFTLNGINIRTIGPLSSNAEFKCSGINDEIVFSRAISAASSGDLILVLPGEYNFNNTLIINNNIYLYGLGNQDNIKININTNNIGIYIQNSLNCIIKNIYIQSNFELDEQNNSYPIIGYGNNFINNLIIDNCKIISYRISIKSIGEYSNINNFIIKNCYINNPIPENKIQSLLIKDINTITLQKLNNLNYLINNLIIENNNFINPKFNIYISDQNIINLIIRNNILESSIGFLYLYNENNNLQFINNKCKVNNNYNNIFDYILIFDINNKSNINYLYCNISNNIFEIIKENLNNNNNLYLRGIGFSNICNNIFKGDLSYIYLTKSLNSNLKSIYNIISNNNFADCSWIEENNNGLKNIYIGNQYDELIIGENNQSINYNLSIHPNISNQYSLVSNTNSVNKNDLLLIEKSTNSYIKNNISFQTILDFIQNNLNIESLVSTFKYYMVNNNLTIDNNTNKIGYLLNSKNNSITITLPSSNTLGNILYFKVIDYTNQIILNRNGNKIQGINDNLELNLDSECYLIWSTSDYGWIIYQSETTLFKNYGILNLLNNQITYEVINSNTNLVKYKCYFVSTLDVPITLTLPSAVNSFDLIYIIPINFNNNITINRNGHKIEGKNENLIIDENVKLTLQYISPDYGWSVIIN